MKGKDIYINDGRITCFEDGSIIRYYKNSKPSRRDLGHFGDTGYRLTNIHTSQGRKSFRVHRLIAMAFLMEYADDLVVDHINGDRTDNRADNLRMTTIQGNNRGFLTKRRGASSQYRGVAWVKRTSKWEANARVDTVLKHLGYYDSERDAAIARDTYVFSQGYPTEGLNFPENYAEFVMDQEEV